MDGTTLIYGAVTLVLAVILSCYTVLVLLSPALVVPHEQDKKYRSRNTPNPTPLPSIHADPEVDLTVVVPAFNETQRMPTMLKSTLAYLASAASPAKTHEVLIVDDGSRDDTSDLAMTFAKENPGHEIRVVTLHRNLGKGGAVRHGMMHGRGKRLLMVDADGASRFEDVNLLWDAMDKFAEDASIAIGSRAHLVKTEAVVKRSVVRNVLMYGLHTILRVVGVGHIRDTQCGFKLFSRRAAQLIFPYQHLCTWIFDVEVLLLAKQLRVPVAEVPIEWHEVSGSKLNVLTDSLQMLRDLLILRANLVFGRWVAPPATTKQQIQ
ncbi:Alg5-prov protein [Irpex rosettiformis]|uniref:Alg5-prov protein n=1 Tax=Irpex rosettiformis TaxID=378272 RepID=A0ACB8UAY3_9APHY|nr:Alg5-prov protein [Irpex rosettiformis]